MMKDEILQLLVQSGLGAYEDRIENYILPSLRIALEPEEDENIATGQSKLGGKPDLPPETAWPRWENRNMSFVAQIQLGRLPELPIDSPLPADGLLSFFYAVEAMYEEARFYEDPATCRVLYTPAEAFRALERRPLPQLEDTAVFKPNRMSFSLELSVPTAESAYLESWGLGWNNRATLEDYNRYWDVFLRQFYENMNIKGYLNRLLGHPDQIQGDMQRSCEIKSKRVPVSSVQDPAMRAQQTLDATKWRLLLQIDSEEANTGIMFGDVGRIYFWIHEDDLESGQFDRVVCEMQC